ncbi:MAG TPA: YIP1 family protein [Candidatus Obscuribacterales bacterium]
MPDPEIDATNPDDSSQSSLPVEAGGAKKKEVPAQAGFFQAYLQQVKSVLMTPKKFFDEMPDTGGLAQPAIFLTLSAFVFSLLQSIAFLNPFLLFKSLFSTILGVLIASALIQFLLKKMGGKSTFEGTFRVLAYSKATVLFAWLTLGPFPIGGIASLVYGVYLNIVGLRKVHEVERTKTIGVVVGLALIGFAIKKLTGF